MSTATKRQRVATEKRGLGGHPYTALKTKRAKLVEMPSRRLLGEGTSLKKKDLVKYSSPKPFHVWAPDYVGTVLKRVVKFSGDPTRGFSMDPPTLGQEAYLQWEGVIDAIGKFLRVHSHPILHQAEEDAVGLLYEWLQVEDDEIDRVDVPEGAEKVRVGLWAYLTEKRWEETAEAPDEDAIREYVEGYRADGYLQQGNVVVLPGCRARQPWIKTYKVYTQAKSPQGRGVDTFMSGIVRVDRSKGDRVIRWLGYPERAPWSMIEEHIEEMTRQDPRMARDLVTRIRRGYARAL